MLEKSVAKKTAQNILLKYKLSEVTIDNLLFLLNESGYEFVEYTPNADEEANLYIERLNLKDYADKNSAFTFCKGSIKIVFMRENLSIEEKRYALAHEYGHIINGHLDKKCSADGNVSDEQEANEFAHFLLNPSIFVRAAAIFYNNKKRVLIAICVIAVLAFAAVKIVGDVQSAKYFEDFYVTDTGYKYHTKDCPYIKEKGNIRRLTKNDYETGLYSRCQICIENED